LVNAVFAQIALFHFAGPGIPYGDVPRAGRNAGFAAIAEVGLQVDKPIGTRTHGSCGAGGHALGFFAVKTGKISKLHGMGPLLFVQRLPNLTKGADDLISVNAAALHFTGFAAYTLRMYMCDADFIHASPPAMKKI
jgi:hypothetical protein